MIATIRPEGAELLHASSSIPPPPYAYDPPPGYTERDPLRTFHVRHRMRPLADALVGSVLCAQGAYALWGARAGLATLGAVGGLAIARAAHHLRAPPVPQRAVPPLPQAC